MASRSYFLQQKYHTATMFQNCYPRSEYPAINIFTLNPPAASLCNMNSCFVSTGVSSTIETTALNPADLDTLDTFNIFDFGMEELVEVCFQIFDRIPLNNNNNNKSDQKNSQQEDGKPSSSSSLSILGINPEHMRLFLCHVRVNYFDTVPFHNFRHAVNVLQTLHCFFINIAKNLPSSSSSSFQTELSFSNSDIFLCYLAAICHDLQHPGIDNNLLTVLNDPLALKYNYNAILEQHHCSCCYSILNYMKSSPYQDGNSGSGADLLAQLGAANGNNQNNSEEGEYQKLIAILIGATEVPRHHIIKNNIDKLAQALQKNNNNNSNNSSDDDQTRRRPLSEVEKRDLLCAILEAADISNEARKNFDGINKKWSVRVTAEFLKSGDALRQAGKPVPDPQNREKLDIGAGQQFFTNFMCKPLYESLNTFFSVRCPKVGIFADCLVNFKNNTENNWAKVTKEESYRLMAEEEKRIDDDIKRFYAKRPTTIRQRGE